MGLHHAQQRTSPLRVGMSSSWMMTTQIKGGASLVTVHAFMIFVHVHFLWGVRRPLVQRYIEVGQTEAPLGESSAWHERRHRPHPYRSFLRDPSCGDVGKESGALSRLNPSQVLSVEVHLGWASVFFHSAKSSREGSDIQLLLLVLRSGGCLGPIFNYDSSVHTNYIFLYVAGVSSPRVDTPCRHPF